MGIAERGAALEKARLGEPERLGARLAALEVMVEVRHEGRRGRVRHSPQRRDGRPDAGREKSAAEALDAFAAQQAPALGFAGAQHGELHTLELQLVRFLQEQVVGPAGALPRRGEQDARLLHRVRVGDGVCRDMEQRRNRSGAIQVRLAIVRSDVDGGGPRDLGGDRAHLVARCRGAGADVRGIVHGRGREGRGAKGAKLQAPGGHEPGRRAAAAQHQRGGRRVTDGHLLDERPPADGQQLEGHERERAVRHDAILWQASTREPRIEAAAAVIAQFAPGKTILWDVTARGRDGTVLAQSGTLRFRVAVKPSLKGLIMTRLSASLTRAAACLAVVVAAGTVAAGQKPFTGVSISVSKETAPPGGMAQVKVFITEPKPITMGAGTYAFDAYESVDGIALMNAVEDVAGIALVRGTQVTLAFTSPSGTFGMEPDYPVLTVAGRIPANAPLGLKYPLIFDASTLQLYDGAGFLYPVEAKPGHLITALGLSIHDVVPGSAVVPAGGTVTIMGSGFERGTEIRFKEAKLSRVTYVNPTRIDVVVKDSARMHGMMIRATNPDGTRSVYFSYQRTGPHGASADAVLEYAVPLLPPAAVNAATVAFPAPALLHTYDVAIQNVEGVTASVRLELVDADGTVIGITQLELPSSRYAVRELSELFGFAPDGACTVRVASATPVQVLGASADQGQGTVAPILAR
jgi:hypothetical protein